MFLLLGGAFIFNALIVDYKQMTADRENGFQQQQIVLKFDDDEVHHINKF